MSLRIETLNHQVKTALTVEEPPLLAYRRLSTIDKKELRLAAFGPNEAVIQKGFDFFMKHPNIYRHPHLDQLDRDEEREQATLQFLFYGQNQIISYQDYLENPNRQSVLTYAFYIFNPSLSAKLGVHFYLYAKTIMNLGTEQHQHFVDRAVSFKDIGCFALTEALHGSNVRGILTQAVYDHKTQEFVIHSPNRDAMKFWIGAAASTANMSVVWAQLYLDGVCHGVHAFVVPIRRTDNHEILPGITMGDCGPKIGLQGTDNGFMMFDRVRVPRANLLSRLSGVDENGKFFSTIPSPEKRFGIQLGALSGGRILFAFAAPGVAMTALAIAIRYTMCRRQFSAPKTTQETLLFEYPLTKYRLMPLLAQSLVYSMGAQELVWIWDSNSKNLLDPKNKVIEELHAISSALKAKSTWYAAQAVNECRQMLGGHGYSAFSRLGALYNDNDVNQTYEGDNNVLLQQTAKYILQAARKLAKGKQNNSKTLNFLLQPPDAKQLTEQNIDDVKNLELILEKRVADKLTETGTEMMTKKAEGMADYDVWNSSQVFYAHTLSHYYGDMYYMQASRRIIDGVKDSRTKQVLTDSVRLWTYNTLLNTGYGTDDQKKVMRVRIVQLCEVLAKEAAGILDAVAPPSKIIGSPFADENGDGMKMYYNLVLTGKNAFKKPDWAHIVTDRDRS